MGWSFNIIQTSLFTAACLIPCFVSAQNIPDSCSAEDLQKQQIENVSEQTESEMDVTDMVSNLEYYKQHPINLNQADYDDLQKLGFLDDIHIKNLLDHIQKNGKLLSILELQTVEGFDAGLIEMMLPYVEVIDYNHHKFNFRDITKFGTNDIMFRYQRIIEKQKGYTNVSDSVRQLTPGSYYLGSPDKLYLKYRFNYFNNIKIGITAEKDAGEQFFKGSNHYGFDFYSGYINVNNIGILKNVVVGDYLLQFGQGFTLWTGSSFGKSADAVAIKKSGRGILPSNSVYENGFMRGGAFTLEYNSFSLSGFYSNKKIDGNIISDTSESIEAYISSLPDDGLHNTLSRIAKEKTVSEQIMGGHFGYKNRALDVGITAYATHFSQELHKDFHLYNEFEFSGNRNFNIGVHYSYIFQNYNFFGETAMSQNMGLSTLNGIMASINKSISVGVSYRYYQPKYQSLYSSAFSQSNSSCNESGIYTGIIIKPHYKVIFSAYADFYHYPWLKYQVNGPSDGYDFNTALEYKPTKKIAVQLRYKFENSMKNTDDDAVMIVYTVPVHRQSYRFNIVYPVAKYLFLSNRVDVVNYRKSPHEAEWGYFLSQDIRYRNPQFPLAFSFRFSIFDTPSYYSRIYTYENDVLYAYSLPSLYDKGVRYYLLVEYKLGRHVEVWLRFAQTCYNDKNIISSGLNEIQGNTQSEIKAQLRFKF